MATQLSFRQQLLNLGNDLRAARALPETEDLSDACRTATQHIVRSTQAVCGHFPVPASFDDADAGVGVVFSYLVGTAIAGHLAAEDVAFNSEPVLARAALDALASHNPEHRTEIMEHALQEYHAIVEAARSDAGLDQYLQACSQAVRVYIGSGDEALVQVFGELYMTLFRAQAT